MDDKHHIWERIDRLHAQINPQLHFPYQSPFPSTVRDGLWHFDVDDERLEHVDESCVKLKEPLEQEDIPSYVVRQMGKLDKEFCKQIIGACNEFKEGDVVIGVAAASRASRARARHLLSNTTISWLTSIDLHADSVTKLLDVTYDRAVFRRIQLWPLNRLKSFLLHADEEQIRFVMSGLHSMVIGCVVKLMSNDELTRVSNHIFNTLPGTQIGARGYFGARIQPNSPTDDPEDIVMQVHSHRCCCVR